MQAELTVASSSNVSAPQQIGSKAAVVFGCLHQTHIFADEFLLLDEGKERCECFRAVDLTGRSAGLQSRSTADMSAGESYRFQNRVPAFKYRAGIETET